MSDQERTHDATPLRLRRARQEGQIARSDDLASALSLGGGLLLLLWMGGGLLTSLGQGIRESLEQTTWSSAGLLSQVTLASRIVALTLVPLLLGCWAVAVASRLLQGGWVWVPSKLAPDISRITPHSGWSRIFSTQSATRTLMAALKATVVLAVAAGLLWHQRFTLAAFGSHSVALAGEMLGRTIARFSLQIAGCLAAMGLLDYFYQRWQLNQRLQMTDDERREELRAIEGDPQLIPHRRRFHQELRGGSAATAGAPRQVVLFNGHDGAVLLECRNGDFDSPWIVSIAEGADSEQLVVRSQREGIPLIEEPQLSRRDVRFLRAGGPLPARQFQSIATAWHHAVGNQAATQSPALS